MSHIFVKLSTAFYSQTWRIGSLTLMSGSISWLLGLVFMTICGGFSLGSLRKSFDLIGSVRLTIERYFFRIILVSPQPLANFRLPENLLSILERLNTMPTDASEVNEFWIPSFASKPPTSSLPPQEEEDMDAVEAEDDWRTFFDTPAASTLPTPPSKKGQSQRVYRLSTHQSLHSLASHRAQFSACWMALLPHFSASTVLSTRALNFLHRGVMPHLNKPLRLMDWIGGCVDHGRIILSITCCTVVDKS